MDSMFSISDFNKGKANKIFDVVRKRKVAIVVKNNKPECVLVSPEEYRRIIQRLKEADEIEKEYKKLQGISDDDSATKEVFYSVSDDDSW